MYDKFTLEELIIRVLPGGFFLTIMFLIFRNKIHLDFTDNLDFLYTFMFFCSAFITGVSLQAISHETEWLIDIFFKFRRPSKVFLYKNNPVLKNEYKREKCLEKLELTKEKLEVFEKTYSDLSILWWKRKKTEDNLSQSIFWKLYSQVSNIDEIKTVNRNYLFTRVMIVEFLLISILLFLNDNNFLGIISFFISIIFLWRSRGLARGLVLKTVILNLKKE